MRFLVTGGAGFIGSHLVGHLLEADHEVIVLDDFSTGRKANLESYLGQVNLLRSSVTDRDACAAAVAGVDYVFHQAALPSVPRSVRDPLTTHEASSTGTLNVLLAARDAGVKRVIYAASSSAYGDTPELPKREDRAPLPRSPYAAAKLAGEEYCRAFWHSYGVPTVSLRYFNIFGPRQDPTSLYGAAVPKFIAAALAAESPTIHGDGEQTRDFTYVGNVVRANRLALEAPEEAFGEVFNIGCGERISINDLWSRIKRATDATVDPVFADARPGDVRDSLASIEKARRVLGYEPLVSLDQGLERTIEAFAAARVEG